MKTIKILLSVILLSTSIASAQQINPKSGREKGDFDNIITVNALEASLGILSLGYEKVISNKGSFDIDVIYYGSSINDTKEFRKENVKANYLSLNTGYKHYIKRQENRPQGWYARGGIITDYGQVKETTGSKEKGNIFSLGGELRTGYQLILPKFLKGLTADIGIGAEYRKFFISNSDINLKGVVLPSLELSLGYAF